MDRMGMKTERPSNGTETSDSVMETATSSSNYLQSFDAPIDCCHSIFGSPYSWDRAVVKSDASLNTEDPEWKECDLSNKITITDLKCDPSPGIIQIAKTSTPEFKAEQVFDKSSDRERLKCPKCYFLTDNRGNLKQHMKVHLRPNECTLYKCEFCDFKTKYKNSIQGHLSRHNRPKTKRGRKIRKI